MEMTVAIFIRQSTTGLWVAFANFSKEFAQCQGLQLLSSVKNPHRVRVAIAIFNRQFTYCIEVAIAISVDSPHMMEMAFAIFIRQSTQG